MPNSFIPPGYQAVLLGSVTDLKDLDTFTPLEEGTAEGSLMLARLDLAGFPSDEALAGLEKALRDKGVPSWPGYSYIVYADTTTPSVYLAWQKGLAWMPIIIGILITTVLPVLLGGVIWWLLPQSLKDLISGMINLGMMAVVMFLMMQLMKPLTAPEKPKRVEKPRELEEAKT